MKLKLKAMVFYLHLKSVKKQILKLNSVPITGNLFAKTKKICHIKVEVILYTLVN